MEKRSELWTKFAENTKEWEGKNQVFGHTQKSNPHRPRALLCVTVSSASPEEDGEEVFLTSSKTPFSGSAWAARKAIEQCKV